MSTAEGAWLDLYTPIIDLEIEVVSKCFNLPMIAY